MIKKSLHQPYEDEELDPVEASDGLPMIFQAELPSDNCLACDGNYSDEYCAACEANRQAREEHSPDRVRPFWGKSTPRSPRTEQILQPSIAKLYVRSATPAFRGRMCLKILRIANGHVFA